jgi:hypothetical protein
MTRDSLLVSKHPIQGSLCDDNGAMVNVTLFVWGHPQGGSAVICAGDQGDGNRTVGG